VFDKRRNNYGNKKQEKICKINTSNTNNNFLVSTNTFSHQEIKYKEIAIIEGDTLWDIAENEKQNNSYYKGQDIRDIIESIKKINNLETSNLKSGQILEIAIY